MNNYNNIEFNEFFYNVALRLPNVEIKILLIYKDVGFKTLKYKMLVRNHFKWPKQR